MYTKKEIDKRYYEKHKERIREEKRLKGNAAYKQNPELFKERRRRYRQNNLAKVREQDRKYSKKWRAKILSRHKIKYTTDTHYRVKMTLRNRIHAVLHGTYKSQRTMKLLGCSMEYFLKYMESRFIGGMTWENMGEWHIDHIRPCASFDLSIPEQQRMCFHHTNLQPLWEIDNLTKGAQFFPMPL